MGQWSDILRQQGIADDDSADPDALELVEQLHQPIRDWDESVEQAKADRKHGRMEEQAFRSIGTTAADANVWDYLPGDGGVVIVGRVTGSFGTRDALIHANVVDTAILQKPPASRKKPIDDIDLQQKDPRKRAPRSLPAGSVWLRKYQEVTTDGNPITGYQNNRRGRGAQKYWQLPVQTGEPLQWWSTAAVLGHCRMEREDGLEMCYDRNQRDFKLLIDKYHEDVASDGGCKLRNCMQCR